MLKNMYVICFMDEQMTEVPNGLIKDAEDKECGLCVFVGEESAKKAVDSNGRDVMAVPLLQYIAYHEGRNMGRAELLKAMGYLANNP